MPIEKIDKKSREVLSYLNINSDLSASTLADAFNQHFVLDYKDSLRILKYLERQSLVSVKFSTASDFTPETVVMIQLTHEGRTYEQNLSRERQETTRKLIADRGWNIITIIISSLLSVLINLIMQGGNQP